VCFQKLVRPAIARLAGRCATGLPKLRARLDAELHGRPGRRYFVLAHLHRQGDSFVVQPLANQCSALVRAAADANAIVTVREAASGSKTGLHRGEMVDVEVFDWTSVFESSYQRRFSRCAS
jgi:molybdopterin biosynthesis enzyme